MSYDKNYFVDYILKEFNVDNSIIELSLDEKGEILGHCFFGDFFNKPLEKLLEKNTDVNRIKKYISLIQFMYEHGDDYIKNVVEVTILEYQALGNEEILKNFYNYLPPNLYKITKEIKEKYGTVKKKR